MTSLSHGRPQEPPTWYFFQEASQEGARVLKGNTIIIPVGTSRTVGYSTGGAEQSLVAAGTGSWVDSYNEKC